MKIINHSLLLILFCFLLLPAIAESVVYVDSDAPSGGNGNSWSTAYESIQAGINDADVLDEEVWVAEGMYNENITLKDGVALYGGFSGLGELEETARDQRDWQNNLTIIDGSASDSVVIGADNATIDGFTLQNGFSTAGGGISCKNVSPAITHCTLVMNSVDAGSGEPGGGIYNENSSPVITSCTFSQNSAAEGGGIYNINSTPTIANCIFSENNANEGGGIFNVDSSPTIISCIFSDNNPDPQFGVLGGGLHNDNSSPTIANCFFTGNVANEGGGIRNQESSDSIITNCTFSENSARDKGGGISNDNSSPTIANCILWGDTSVVEGQEIHNANASSPMVKYCDIEGSGGSGGGWNASLGTDAGGNIDADPQFGTDFHLQAISPCIDAGDNTAVPIDIADLDGDGDIAEPIPFDLDGTTRFFDDPATPDTGNGTPPIVDMGADEFEGSPPSTTTTSIINTTTTIPNATTSTILSTTTTTGTTPDTTTTTTKKRCLSQKIYGEDSEEVEILRYLRDNVLSQAPEGQEIIGLYYQWSPVMVRAMENDEEFKEEVKEMIEGILLLIMEEDE